MKQLTIILLAAFFITACSKKSTPTTAKKEEVPQQPVPVAQPAEPAQATVAATNGRVNTVLLAAGQKMYEANCGKCHDLKKPDTYTQERWVGLVRWMAPKAKITEEQAAQVLAYVQFNAKDAPKDKSNM